MLLRLCATFIIFCHLAYTREEAPGGNTTRTVAMWIRAGSDPREVAKKAGLTYEGPIANLREQHLFSIPVSADKAEPVVQQQGTLQMLLGKLGFRPFKSGKESQMDDATVLQNDIARAIMRTDKKKLGKALEELFVPKAKRAAVQAAETLDAQDESPRDIGPIRWYDIQVEHRMVPRLVEQSAASESTLQHKINSVHTETRKRSYAPLRGSRAAKKQTYEPYKWGGTDELATLSQVQRASTLVSEFEDPLYGMQWHLQAIDAKDAWNIYQPSSGVFSSSIPRGKPAGILIVDDGLESGHPDLADNFSPNRARSHDFNGGSSGNWLPTPHAGDGHGTSAAGVAAAVANKVCGVGVAYKSSLAGVRLIAVPVSDATEANGVTFGTADGNDVVSCSWGPRDDGMRLEGPGTLASLAIQTAVTQTGRGGLGTVYVWASGNGRADRDSCGYDGYASSRFVVAVGAVGSDGRLAWYSEGCAALMLVAPSSSRHGMRSIVTTGASGDSVPSNPAACNTGFGGTSAAAPMVAGVVALMLTANPALTWRDVQDALIHTCSPPPLADDYNAWTPNGAGLRRSNMFGFGIVNASAAVRYVTSANWKHVPGPQRVWESAVVRPSLNVPDGTGQWVTSSVSAASEMHARDTNAVSMEESVGIETRSEMSRDPRDTAILNISTVEWVEVYFTAASGRRGDLNIKLTSPVGTVSVLATEHGDSNRDFNNWKFSSCDHWGESAVGTWTLSVADTRQNYQSTFQSCMFIMPRSYSLISHCHEQGG